MKNKYVYIIRNSVKYACLPRTDLTKMESYLRKTVVVTLLGLVIDTADDLTFSGNVDLNMADNVCGCRVERTEEGESKYIDTGLLILLVENVVVVSKDLDVVTALVVCVLWGIIFVVEVGVLAFVGLACCVVES